MSVLVDAELSDRMRTELPLATDVSPDDCKSANAKIQAASVDLTIGEIFVPGTAIGTPGGAGLGLREHSLAQGHTAVIRTKEKLNIPPDLAGIAFPPASMSLKGLLMTNPGHVDPGYRGALHLTVINMGHLPFSLKAGDRVVRLLIVELGRSADTPYGIRHPSAASDPISPELLGRLSMDFVNVTARAEKIAKRAVKRAKLFSIAIPIVVALTGVAGSILAAYLTQNGELQKISTRLTTLEAKLAEKGLEARLEKLETRVSDIAAQNVKR